MGIDRTAMHAAFEKAIHPFLNDFKYHHMTIHVLAWLQRGK